MDLSFSSEQGILRDSAAKFLSAECPYARVKEIEESEEGFSPELWRQVAELGWTGLLFPEQYGGYGAEFLDLVIIQEEIGKMVFPSPFFSTVIQCGLAILEGGTEAQKEDLLARITEGSLIMALAQHEAEGSYLESGIKMEAEADDDQYVLNGTKMFVVDANIAQKLIVAARTAEGLSLFVVDTDDPGVTISKMPTIAMDNSCEVVFKDVKVAKENVLGTPGNGWAVLQSMTAKATVAKAAEMIGGCKVCIDMTAAYAKERVQYGKPIGGFQIIQHYMANMLMSYDTIYNYLYRVAYLIDEGEDFGLEASVLKACVNENYKFIADRAVQIHGGIGTTRDYDVALFFRKVKSWEFICGDTDYHYENVMDKLIEGIPEW
jgi:alkylation response protein AidB-like acyl-CoA dehydrogenase